MMDELNKLFAGSWEAKSGTIYPLLTKLDNEKGLLIGDKKPSPLGPVKKVYSLTEKGRKLIDSIVEQYFNSDMEFILRYIELLTPFILNFEGNEREEEIFEKIIQIPIKSIAITMEKMATTLDFEFKTKKLEGLKANLEKIIRNINQELQNITTFKAPSPTSK
jgi:DNA-binding PadR family transcriptional regulator